MSHPDLDWMDHAACAGHGPDLWFPGESANTILSYAEARTICQACPVLEACDRYANVHLPYAEATAGMFAGLTPRERRRARRQTEPTRKTYGERVCPHCHTRFIARHQQAVLCGDLACEKAAARAARQRFDEKRRGAA